MMGGPGGAVKAPLFSRAAKLVSVAAMSVDPEDPDGSPRIWLLLDDRAGLSESQQAVFDWIVESRGTMIRPYEVMLHVPDMARPAAELGHQIRYEGGLSDHDRELAIIATAAAQGCAYEWDTHVGLARAAGVAETTITTLRHGDGTTGSPDDAIIGFVREMCATSRVSDAVCEAVRHRLGTSGVVELSTLVGYYTMLAFVINVAEPEEPVRP